MPIIAVSVGKVVLIAVIVIGVLAILTWLLKRRRSDVWHKLARRHDLSFAEEPEGPRVWGKIDGRAVEVRIQEAGSDRDVGGVEVLLMSVVLQGVPRDMSSEGEPGLIGDLAVLAEDRIEFQHEEFNRDALVKGDEAVARDYWTPPRQQAFLELVHTAPCDQIAIQEGTLIAELREIVSDQNRLEQLLAQLLQAADRLDGSGRLEKE